MTIDMNDLIRSITESLNRIDYIKAEEIPNIELYMDQVTTFMDSRLRQTVRNKEEDRILTKTMINNYAKNDILPPPVKKKYTKDHMIDLLFIYYFKSFLSINDIEELLGPINDKYFGKEEGLNLVDIYERLRSKQEEHRETIIDDIKNKYDIASKMFETGDEEEEEILNLFAFTTLLSADVCIKKLLIEKLIDGYIEKQEQRDKESFEKKNSKEK